MSLKEASGIDSELTLTIINRLNDDLNTSKDENPRFENENSDTEPNLNTTNNQTFNEDLNPLHYQVKKLQKLLVLEQDKYSKLQSRLQESENQRLELISSSNKDSFSLATQFTKLRSEYEKNEAIRRSLEYDLTLARNSLNKEKNLTIEKEKITEESNKFYEDQLRHIKKENLKLNSIIANLDDKYSKKDSEHKKYALINKEQENLINSLKEESALNKDIIDRFKSELEFYREKVKILNNENEQINKKVQSLEAHLKTENDSTKDLKQIFDSEREKNIDLLKKIKIQDEKKIELEVNLEKLIDQLKENRKELFEEQTKSKDIKERFKLVETELKLTNAELTKKLEEKVSAIKKLSDQLNSHEKDLNSIKTELKQTNLKQLEFDKCYDSCMKDIKGILSLVKSQSNELKSDSFLKFQKSIEKLKIENQTLSPLVQFTKQFEILKKIIQEFLNFLKIKSNESNESKLSSEKSKLILQENEKKMKEIECLNQRLCKDIDILRNERVALEESVQSFRNECENLKSSLNKQFEINDSLKTKYNYLSKKLKENDSS